MNNVTDAAIQYEGCQHEAWEQRHGHRTCADCGAYLTASPAHPIGHGEREARRFRHKKRGTEYALIGVGRAQGTLNDEDPVVLYRGKDGSLWARHQVEFSDGRFEEILTPTGSAEPEIPAGVSEVCDVCGGSGKNNSHQLWPGCACRACNGAGKIAYTPKPVASQSGEDALREALQRLVDEKKPAYHDCLDAGEPQCAWCDADEALATLSHPTTPAAEEAGEVERLRAIAQVVADADSTDLIGSLDVDIPHNGYPRQWIRDAARAALTSGEPRT